MKSKLNNIYFGLGVGICLPVISLIALHQIKYYYYTIAEFIDLLNKVDVLTKILSLSVIPNLLIFFIFIWTNKLLSARGVLLSTIIYAILIFILKFLF